AFGSRSASPSLRRVRRCWGAGGGVRRRCIGGRVLGVHFWWSPSAVSRSFGRARVPFGSILLGGGLRLGVGARPGWRSKARVPPGCGLGCCVLYDVPSLDACPHPTHALRRPIAQNDSPGLSVTWGFAAVS